LGGGKKSESKKKKRGGCPPPGRLKPRRFLQLNKAGEPIRKGSSSLKGKENIFSMGGGKKEDGRGGNFARGGKKKKKVIKPT